MPRFLALAAAAAMMYAAPAVSQTAAPAPAPSPAPALVPAPAQAPAATSAKPVAKPVAKPAAKPAAAASAAPAAVPVPLTSQPRTWMDTAARSLTAQDLSEARRAGEAPLVLVGSTKLSAAPTERAALFVQLQSSRECGSAGCSTIVYVWRNNAWVRVLDGVAGKLSVAATRTKGMSDLLTEKDRYVWNGTEYHDTNPAPQVDLRPRPRR